MATIINNPQPSDRTVFESDSSSGWVATVIILLVLIFGGVYLWMQYRRAPAPQPGASINVTLPAGNSGTQYPAQ